MTDDQHGQGGTPPGGSRWDPLPQGDYDDGATAFVNFPEGGIDALLDSMESPLAAPGHGYVPPQITVTPATTAGTDPAATGTWAAPGAPADGARWNDPGSAQADAVAGDRFGYDPGASGQWAYDPNAAGPHHAQAQDQDPAGRHRAPGHAPGQDVTGQWSIPVAGGDLPDESGEFTASSLVEQWGGAPPATLPGGAAAPWAESQSIGTPWGPGVPGVPQGHEQQDSPQGPQGGERAPQGGEHGSEGGERAPQSGEPGPEGGAHGPQPGVHEPQSGVHGPQPGVHEPQPGAHEPQSGVHEPQSGVHGPQPGVHEPQSGVHEPQSGVHEPQSGAHEPQSGVHGPQSGSQEPRDGELGPQGEAHGPQVDAHGPQGGAHGSQPGPHGPQGGGHGPEAGEQAPQPGADGQRSGSYGTEGGDHDLAHEPQDASATRPHGGAPEHGRQPDGDQPPHPGAPGASPEQSPHARHGDHAHGRPQAGPAAEGAPAHEAPHASRPLPAEAYPEHPRPSGAEQPWQSGAGEAGAAEGREHPQAPQGAEEPAPGASANDGGPEDARTASRPSEGPSESSAGDGASADPHTAPEADGPGETDAPAADLVVAPHDDHPLASYVLRVNGTDRPVTDAWIGESLLYVLRERLGLAGAKDGCSQGECGACNVQVDGRLVASCLVPAVTAAGSEVRTVEGLAQDGRPSDVQRALARCGAVQCGFCVPGMAMTVHDLLEGNPAPTELETRQALCGNLCRCSGYRGVVTAVQEVVAEREAKAEAAADDGDGTPRIPHQAGPGAGGVGPSAFGVAPQDQPHGQDGGQA
ncbi:2Fe-2S iron-sulfur cluster-binding protein [Streptomyces sp. NPDC096105]|uniref:2Fe-2S iron-sulfur cluster-binding protein n=1 Tax=Streptomyces sp. NPDC096105 TaxID=3366074 RepID=UPI0037FB5C21